MGVFRTGISEYLSKRNSDVIGLASDELEIRRYWMLQSFSFLRQFLVMIRIPLELFHPWALEVSILT